MRLSIKCSRLPLVLENMWFLVDTLTNPKKHGNYTYCWARIKYHLNEMKNESSWLYHQLPRWAEKSMWVLCLCKWLFWGQAGCYGDSQICPWSSKFNWSHNAINLGTKWFRLSALKNLTAIVESMFTTVKAIRSNYSYIHIIFRNCRGS